MRTFMLLTFLLAAPLAAQNKEWKNLEEIGLGDAFTRTIKLEQESFVRVTAVKDAKFQCEFVEGAESYEFSGWRKLPKGEYAVRVKSDKSNQGKVRLTVLSAAEVDPSEPAFENWRYAVNQEPGKPFQASLLPERDVDYFVVNIGRRAHVRVDATGPEGKKPEAAIHWVDAQGQRLEPPATEGRELAAGQWVLAVACTAADLAEPHRVKLLIQDTRALDANEPNDERDLAKAISVGTSVSGTLQTSADTDWFAFNAPAAGAVVVQLAGLGNSKPASSLSFAVFQRGDEAIASDGGGCSVSRGPCWLRVGPGAKELAGYVLKVHFIADTTEPNADTPACSLHVGAKRELWLPTVEDVDAFSLELDEPQILWVSCQNAKGAGVYMPAQWFDASGAKLEHAPDKPLPPGRYIVKLRRVDKEGFIGEPFSVRLAPRKAARTVIRPLAEVPKLGLGSRKAFVLDAENGAASFKFELAEAGSVIVRLESSPGVAVLREEFEAYLVEGEGESIKWTYVDGPKPLPLGKGVFRLVVFQTEGASASGGFARITYLDDKTTILPPAK